MRKTSLKITRNGMFAAVILFAAGEPERDAVALGKHRP